MNRDARESPSRVPDELLAKVHRCLFMSTGWLAPTEIAERLELSHSVVMAALRRFEALGAIEWRRGRAHWRKRPLDLIQQEQDFENWETRKLARENARRLEALIVAQPPIPMLSVEEALREKGLEGYDAVHAHALRTCLLRPGVDFRATQLVPVGARSDRWTRAKLRLQVKHGFLTESKHEAGGQTWPLFRASSKAVREIDPKLPPHGTVARVREDPSRRV